ncbi:DsbA family protein [Candidatus Viridilinea mediisalina]|uniref:Thioredoxin domain-containing protein n=1 Tax=Candidatus Viridilinea mediisalina TaxID=2024553 RepID=A0A2A6RP62_9CHLR|nr:thioredoxin domain-containing protein [Candidatus Viridilinea mediisalina]PDW04630.1 hypothetical protein CJ255_02310 [Candidatus Viridilinea mediisalina]
MGCSVLDHAACSKVIGIILLLLLLTACGIPSASEPSAPTIARLPSVTPASATHTPRPTQVITVVPAPTRVPTATPPPTATPEVVFSDAGPITASMAQLGLSGAGYAALGDPHAPITIVEFTDFGCEFCRRFHMLTFPELKAEYIETGLVYYIIKDLPVTSRQSGLAAQAAACAGLQAGYWPMHRALFAEPSAWRGNEAQAIARISAAAAEVGLEVERLTACVTQGAQSASVDRSVNEAHELHVYGTPTFFINAKLLAGAHSINLWREILDAELEQH